MQDKNKGTDKDPLAQIRELLVRGEQRFSAIEQRLEDVAKRGKAPVVPGTPEGKCRAAEWFREVLDGGKPTLRMTVAPFARADLAFGTNSAGGYVVPAEQERSIIEELGARLVVVQSGATQRLGLKNSPYKEPRIDTEAAAYWRAENADATESNPVFGEVNMTPKTCIALGVMSREAAMLSDPQLEQVVRDHLSRVVARALDKAALEGAGSSGEPAGLLNTSGVLELTIGGVPAADDLYDMLYAVEAENADVGSLGWVMNPRDLNTIRKLKDGDGRYLLQPALSAGQPNTLLGYPVRLSTQVSVTGGTGSEGNIYFGNWQDLIWGQWGVIEITASTEAEDYYKKNQLGVRAVAYVDFGLKHPKSFVVGAGTQ